MDIDQVSAAYKFLLEHPVASLLHTPQNLEQNHWCERDRGDVMDGWISVEVRLLYVIELAWSVYWLADLAWSNVQCLGAGNAFSVQCPM